MDSLYTHTNIEKLEINYKILIAKFLLDSWYSILPTLAQARQIFTKIYFVTSQTHPQMFIVLSFPLC